MKIEMSEETMWVSVWALIAFTVCVVAYNIRLTSVAPFEHGYSQEWQVGAPAVLWVIPNGKEPNETNR